MRLVEQHLIAINKLVKIRGEKKEKKTHSLAFPSRRTQNPLSHGLLFFSDYLGQRPKSFLLLLLSLSLVFIFYLF